MTTGEAGATRREVLRGVGLGAGAALLPGTGFAETRGSHSASEPAAATQAAAADEFVVADYWTKKGETKLYLFRKRLNLKDAKPKTAPPVLFFVHGSSISGRSTFDLTVPGAGEYSMMSVFARRGYDCWTMDFDGYGRSGSSGGNSDVKSGVEDLKAATEVVARETGQSKFLLLGESSGALRVAAFAMARPDRVDRMVLEAFVWTGKGSPTLTKRAEQVEFYRAHNRRPRDRAMIRSIFTRDKPGTSDPRVAEALADAELPFGETIPTGTYLDMTAHLPVVDPIQVKAAVMMVRGEYDGIATLDDLLGFFAKLPNPDRQFVMLAGAAHSVNLGLNRHQTWHAIHSFLSMPPRVDT